jgi:hypothetical protein
VCRASEGRLQPVRVFATVAELAAGSGVAGPGKGAGDGQGRETT